VNLLVHDVEKRERGGKNKDVRRRDQAEKKTIFRSRVPAEWLGEVSINGGKVNSPRAILKAIPTRGTSPPDHKAGQLPSTNSKPSRGRCENDGHFWKCAHPNNRQ
jgi:hypothetical protein